MAYHLSDHAMRRAQSRGIKFQDIEQTILFGRRVHARRAVIYVIGRVEVELLSRGGRDFERLHGIHVICCPHTMTILTCYRNRKLQIRRWRRRGR